MSVLTPPQAADSGEVLFFALPRPAHAPAHPPDAFPGHSEAIRARQACFGLSARTFPSLDAVEDRRAVRRPRRERKPPARRLRGPPTRPNRAFLGKILPKSSFFPARSAMPRRPSRPRRVGVPNELHQHPATPWTSHHAPTTRPGEVAQEGHPSCNSQVTNQNGRVRRGGLEGGTR